MHYKDNAEHLTIKDIVILQELSLITAFTQLEHKEIDKLVSSSMFAVLQ